MLCTGSISHSRLAAVYSKLLVHLHVAVRYQVVGGAAYMFKLCPQLAAGTTLGLLSVAAIAQAHGAFNRHMAERTQVTCHSC
jgi:hypothetical protein